MNGGVPVPAVIVAVTTSDWPTSITGAVCETVRTDIGLTVSIAVPEVIVELCESVTVAQ